MLLYSWKKIRNKSGNSSKRIITIWESMLKLRRPYNRYDPIYPYYYDDFSGYSFIKNPKPLILQRHKWRDKEIADYIGLASFRNLGEYLVTKQTTLDRDFCPLSEEALNNNRLLRVKGNKIHFFYEDYTGDK